MFDDVALAERAGDDFHGRFPSIGHGPGRRRRAIRPDFEARNILILRPRASIFGTAEAVHPVAAGRVGLGIPMPQASPWWRPNVHADRQPFLQARRRIRRGAARPRSRRRLSSRSKPRSCRVSPGNEAHLHAFATELVAPDRHAHGALSAHLAGIRLQEAAGGRASGGSSSSPGCSATASAAPLHHPEFTMLEWYRAAAPYEALMEDCAAFLAAAADRRRNHDDSPSAAAAPIRSRRRNASPSPRPSRAMPASTCWPRLRDGEPDRAALAAAGAAAGIRVAADDGWCDIFSRVLVERIEPHLGNGRATVLMDYPRAGGGAGARQAGRPARRRAVRALRLRGRAGQRLRRTDRPGRAAPAVRGRDGEEAAALRRALSDRRGFPRRAGR